MKRNADNEERLNAPTQFYKPSTDNESPFRLLSYKNIKPADILLVSRVHSESVTRFSDMELIFRAIVPFFAHTPSNYDKFTFTVN